ncbi:MAG: phosphopyruvate hydratase [Nitrososphaeraceae archaeon]
MQLGSKYTIKSIIAREILDSRGYPTVEARVCTMSGVCATASAPSGKSTGKHEALELRDSHNIKRFFGKGVLRAVSNVNDKISSVLVGRSCNEQHQIDQLMIEADGTENMRTLGANATTAVSVACAKAAAKENEIPLYQQIAEICSDSRKSDATAPVPIMNIVNGGKHSGSGLAIQEFMIIPIGGQNLNESVRIGSEVYHQLGSILSDNLGKSAANVGDEGGFAPAAKSVKTESVLSYICQAIETCGYHAGSDVAIGIDCAATNFWNSAKSKYIIDGESLNSDSLLDFYDSLCDHYPIKIIEDPFREDDIESFARMTSKLGKKIFVVGDDIFVTNRTRVDLGIEAKAANSIIIKVNQVGTLTAALDAVTTASSKLWGIIASHRSGETNDDWLSDFSVGIGADAIKAGAPARGERVAKYNRLVAIKRTRSDSSFSGKLVSRPHNMLK